MVVKKLKSRGLAFLKLKGLLGPNLMPGNHLNLANEFTLPKVQGII